MVFNCRHGWISKLFGVRLCIHIYGAIIINVCINVFGLWIGIQGPVSRKTTTCLFCKAGLFIL